MRRSSITHQARQVRAFFMAAAIALAGCGGSGSGPSQALVVDVYGDSILAGYGLAVTPIERMRALRPAWRITDHAANGLALKALVPGFAEAPRTGRVVVLGNGLVDAMQGLQGFEQDLRAAVLQLLAEGRVPVLTGLARTPHAPPLAAEYNAATHAVAQEFGLPHAGWWEAYREGDAAPDGVHRTQAASDQLVALLLAAVERAGPAREVP